MRRLAYLLQIHASGTDADTGKGTSDVCRRNFMYLLTSHTIGFKMTKQVGQLPYKEVRETRRRIKIRKMNI